jgi:hypothetical protein
MGVEKGVKTSFSSCAVMTQGDLGSLASPIEKASVKLE